jgi:hypothetical protein
MKKKFGNFYGEDFVFKFILISIIVTPSSITRGMGKNLTSFMLFDAWLKIKSIVKTCIKTKKK